jgi:Glyoxalase-like domain
MEGQMMSPDDSAGSPPGYLARHESGHAAAFLSLGIPLEYVTIVGHGSQLRPHTQPADVTAGTHGQKALVCVSGVGKTVKNRLHLDLRPADQPAEVARLEALGARRVSIGQGDVSWVVMADPEGNEFDVLPPLTADELPPGHDALGRRIAAGPRARDTAKL